MRILNLAKGEFQVFSRPHGKYDMVFKIPNGTYKQLQAQNESELNGCIRIWTEAKYIQKIIK